MVLFKKAASRFLLMKAFAGWLAFFAAVQCFGAPGKLDTSFNPPGVGRVWSIASAPSGGVYVAGSTLQRMTAAGAVDAGFACPVAISGLFDGVAFLGVLPNNTLLLAGTFSVGGRGMHVAHLLADGSLDPNFHDVVLAPEVPAAIVTGAAVDSHGRLVLVGPFTTANGAPAPSIVRLAANGDIDPTFSPPVSLTNARLVTVLPDDRIVVASDSAVTVLALNGSLAANLSLPDGGVSAVGAVSADRIVVGDRFGIRAYKTDLSVDSGFKADFAFSLGVDDVLAAPDQRVLASGVWTGADGASQFGVVRFNPDGTIDRTWTTATQADGRIEHIRSSGTGDLYLSGRFQHVGGTAKPGIARLHGISGSTQWVNTSARGVVSVGQPLILGFAVVGDEPVDLLVRGVGPSLADFGVSGVAQHPKVAIFSGDKKVFESEGTIDTAEITQAVTAAGAFPLRKGAEDATGLTSLPPGVYSLVVSVPDGDGGAVLGEVYRIDRE